MERMITLMVQLRARPGMAAELERHLQALPAAARKEPGCADHHFHRSVDDPNVFAFYENWLSQKDFEEHIRQPIQIEFGENRGALLEGDVDMKFYKMVSPYNK